MAGPPPPPGPPKAPGAPPSPPGAPGAASAVPAALFGITSAKKPQRLSTFVFTQDDVEAAATDLVAKLPEPVKIVATGAKHAIAIVGPKGGKTVASIAVKTTHCGGLPRPKGSITVVLHLDNQAPGSFDNFLYMTNGVVASEESLHFIGIGSSHGRYKARTERNDPAQSAYVKEVVVEVMRRLGQRGDVGLLVFDGYGDFCNGFGGYVAAYQVGLDSPIKLEGTQWYGRREMFEDLTGGGLNAVCNGGFFVLNGPEGGLEQEKDKEPTKLAKRLAKEGFKGREPPAKWLIYRENSQNMSAIIELETQVGTGGVQYLASVWEGRMGRVGINTGMDADITNKNVGAFSELVVPKPPATTIFSQPSSP